MTDNAAPTLVIMAAGLGSRFGGVKQLAVVGDAGESIMDFSIRHAIEAGFADVVLIVRSDIEDDVRAHVANVHGDDVTVRYVRQDDLGPGRAKPWGTLHAVLSARPAVSAPFAVINADDFYGPRTYQVAAEWLRTIEPGQSANIAFDLGATVPPSGAVTRGICEVSDGGLVSIVETEGCERLADGRLMAGGVEVADDTPASMNFWGFHPDSFDGFQQRWDAFFAARGAEEKAECQLPTVVGELMAEGALDVDVLSSPETWIGITNPDDLDLVRAALRGD